MPKTVILITTPMGMASLIQMKSVAEQIPTTPPVIVKILLLSISKLSISSLPMETDSTTYGKTAPSSVTPTIRCGFTPDLVK
jgi:hypothetical protein